jgi:hypothetical protein
MGFRENKAIAFEGGVSGWLSIDRWFIRVRAFVINFFIDSGQPGAGSCLRSCRQACGSPAFFSFSAAVSAGYFWISFQTPYRISSIKYRASTIDLVKTTVLRLPPLK